jgi:hypothetical protein
MSDIAAQALMAFTSATLVAINMAATYRGENLPVDHRGTHRHQFRGRNPQIAHGHHFHQIRDKENNSGPIIKQVKLDSIWNLWEPS